MNQTTKINKTAEISKYLPGGPIFKDYINKKPLSSEDKYIVETLKMPLTDVEILELEGIINSAAQNIQYYQMNKNNSEILTELDVQSYPLLIQQNLSEIYQRMGKRFEMLANEGFELFSVSKKEFCYE